MGRSSRSQHEGAEAVNESTSTNDAIRPVIDVMRCALLELPSKISSCLVASLRLFSRSSSVIEDAPHSAAESNMAQAAPVCAPGEASPQRDAEQTGAIERCVPLLAASLPVPTANEGVAVHGMVSVSDDNVQTATLAVAPDAQPEMQIGDGSFQMPSTGCSADFSEASPAAHGADGTQDLPTSDEDSDAVATANEDSMM